MLFFHFLWSVRFKRFRLGTISIKKNIGMKILIYGQGKSGTTILLYKIKKALENKFPDIVHDLVFEPLGVVENDQGLSFRFLKKQTPVKNNYLVKALVANFKNHGFKLEDVKKLNAEKNILILRDPRDQWLSSFFYKWRTKVKTAPEQFQQVLRLIECKEKNPDLLPMFAINGFSVAEQQLAAEKLTVMLSRLVKIKKHAENNGWLVYYYESLLDNNFEDLNQYLNLKVGDGEVDEKFSFVVRTKATGNWRKWFTPQDVEFFKPIFNAYLTDLGYDATDWKLNSPAELDANQGSNYLKFIVAKGIDSKPGVWKKLSFWRGK